MKHIKKKYLFQHNVALPPENDLIGMFEPGDSARLKSNYKKNNVLLQTDDNDIILAFIYNDSGNYVTIALPDFTLVYFDFAYNLNIERRELQKTLLKKLSQTETLKEDRSKELYNYYGTATSCIINLFTSVESFVNHLLPDDKEYIVKKTSRTEIYNKEQIQEQIPFMDKLKNVLPQFYDKNFFKNPTASTAHLENLKNLRNSLIHTKSDTTYGVHIETFKKLLNFKYNETLEAVVKLFNFYKENYIEPCSCASDF